MCSFTVLQKRIHLGSIFTENYKECSNHKKYRFLWESRWSDPFSWIRRLNLIKMSTFPKLIYKFDIIKINTSRVFSMFFRKQTSEHKKLNENTKDLVEPRRGGRVPTPAEWKRPLWLASHPHLSIPTPGADSCSTSMNCAGRCHCDQWKNKSAGKWTHAIRTLVFKGQRYGQFIFDKGTRYFHRRSLFCT